MARAVANGARDRPAGHSRLWIQGAACGALLAFATPTALLLAVLLAPAMASAAADHGSARGTTRAVALCGAAAALSPVWRLWMAGSSLPAALDLLSDPARLVIAWGAGACAWAACQVLPILVAATWDAREAIRARNIEAELRRCREEWDLLADV